MPGLNQQGPSGQGPGTGQKKGRCAGFGLNKKNRTTTPDDVRSETFCSGQNRVGRGQRLQKRLRGCMQ